MVRDLILVAECFGDAKLINLASRRHRPVVTEKVHTSVSPTEGCSHRGASFPCRQCQATIGSDKC